LVAFFVIAGCSKVNDELAVNSNENQLKSATTERDAAVVHPFISIFTNKKVITCDGSAIFLSGKLDGHCSMFGHYDPAYPPDPSNPVANQLALNKFVWEWMNMRVSGIVTNNASGEEFKINKFDRWNKNQDVYTVRYNLVGNMGSQYILFGTGVLNPSTGFPVLTIDRIICPGSADEE
jgi:hypothetical protein